MPFSQRGGGEDWSLWTIGWLRNPWTQAPVAPGARWGDEVGPVLTAGSSSSSSNLLPRFFARYAEPTAESKDAFMVPDWAVSTCPACGFDHHEALFAFPPPPS